jgi:hypothetical protein
MHEDDTETNPTPSELSKQADQNPDIDQSADEKLVEIVNSKPRFPQRQRPLQPNVGSSMRSTVFTIQNLENYRLAFRISGARSYQGAPVQGCWSWMPVTLLIHPG